MTSDEKRERDVRVFTDEEEFLNAPITDDATNYLIIEADGDVKGGERGKGEAGEFPV